MKKESIGDGIRMSERESGYSLLKMMFVVGLIFSLLLLSGCVQEDYYSTRSICTCDVNWSDDVVRVESELFSTQQGRPCNCIVHKVRELNDSYEDFTINIKGVVKYIY